MSKNKPKKKVIIIGAGIAGLTACTQLIAQGFDAIILEARDHYGGRIRTNYDLGIPLGYGASWIHGIENNPITELAKKFHASKVIVDPSKFSLYDHTGSPFTETEIQKFNEKFANLLEEAKSLASDTNHDISLLNSLLQAMKNYKLTSREQDFFKLKALSLESYVGASYEQLSGKHWNQEETWPGENCFLTGTYQPIIDGLAKNCSVKLNAFVKEINLRKNDIEVVTDTASYVADAAIITVSLGVLKNNTIKFNPPLPTNKQEAIKRLGMGLFNITALKFPKSFWPMKCQAMFFSSFDTIPVFFNLHHFIDEPILLGFSGGNRAHELETLKDEELIEKSMEDFRKIFGRDIPEPESFVNTRWSQDPYSFGSYSYIPTGSSGEDYKTMSETVLDRLFFAGEATCFQYPATTHGAYLSGLRESNLICKSKIFQ